MQKTLNLKKRPTTTTKKASFKKENNFLLLLHSMNSCLRFKKTKLIQIEFTINNILNLFKLFAF
jgi:hypothetical protein